MKIVFAATMYYPRNAGEALYVTELAEELVRRGHEVTVFIPGPRKDYERNGVKIKQFPDTEIARAYSVSLPYLKALIKEPCDIIHSHHYGYFPATAGFIAARMKRVPHVITPHYHPPIYNLKRKLLYFVYYYTQGLYVLKFSEINLPHTIFEKNKLCKIGSLEDRISILPSTIDTKKFKPLKMKKEKTVLYVGPLIEEKGAGVLFNIAENVIRKMPDVKFVFIGSGGLENVLKSKAASYKKNFSFLNGVSEKELIEWYNRASVVALPSKYEAFGRVLAEALACETPVVATKVGGIPEVVIDRETGLLVNYGEWDKMEESIVKILENKKLAAQLGKNGRRYVAGNFSIEVVVDKLEKIYESVVK